MGRFPMVFDSPSKVLRTSGAATPPTGDGDGQAEASRVKKRWETPRVVIATEGLALAGKAWFTMESGPSHGPPS